MRILLLLALASMISKSAEASTPDAVDSMLNVADDGPALRLNAEVGFLAPLAHTIQFGVDGTEIDYLKEGGQDNLFPHLRFSTDLDLNHRQTVVFLIQPLNLETRSILSRDLRVDGLTYPADSTVDFRYGFTFYRGSWLYDLSEEEETELALGFSLQLRNANIGFRSSDGELNREYRDIGPVPVLKIRARAPLGSGRAFVGAEADGFYAPIKYLNGGTSDVVGSILDASLRIGMSFKSGTEGWLNLRYLGGGAEGTSTKATYPSDGYSSNWLSFLTLSAGFTLR